MAHFLKLLFLLEDDLGLRRVLTMIEDACYDTGAPLFFLRFPQFRSLRPLPKKLIWRKKKSAIIYIG